MSVLIKRYANRKLYNTETSRYITLKGIAELIEAGTEVRVLDNESGEDITSITLSQILVDSERTNRAVPGNLLTELIQRSGDVLTALRKGVGDASDGIEGLQRRVGKLINREREGARLPDWIAYAAPDFDRLLQGTMERVFTMLDLPRRSDLEALNVRLERVAKALEERDRKPPPADEPPRS